MKKIYLIAGELSGDMHAAEMMRVIEQRCPLVSFHGAGGGNMEKVISANAVGKSGMTFYRNWIDQAAVMGVVEVLKHYRWFKRQFAEMLAEIKRLQPDALVLIDYPGFNLRMARAVREALPETKIIQYVSPQVWAWNRGRIPKMAKILDRMLCILPFEKKLYEESGLPTTFVGHPIVDEMAGEKGDFQRDENLVGLFPGSREREINKLFPVMIEAARRLSTKRPHLHFEAPAATPALAETMERMLRKGKLDGNYIKITNGGSHSLMQRAHCAIIASGTATLEAAWFGLPYCLVYKIALPTYLLGKMLVKIDHIGIVNILANKTVVNEYIQGDADPVQLGESLERFLDDPEYVALLKRELAETVSLLGEGGVHERVAAAVLEEIGA